MKNWFTRVSIALLIVLLAGNLFVLLAQPSRAWAGATQQSSACLLTPSDIEVATGGKAGAPQPRVDPLTEGGAHVCSWDVAAPPGHVVISIVRPPVGMSVKDFVKQTQMIDGLRAAHFKVEEKDFANALCFIATPPASQSTGLRLSSCVAKVKGMFLSLVFTSPTKQLSIAQVKTLLDQALGRFR